MRATTPFPTDAFRTSSYTRSENCVEVADAPGASAVRDSKNRQIGVIQFPSAEWIHFLGAVKADQT
ncbi:DUF397 domain-containing protein [Streptomonospora nanhaiensis]|uniref:DUF397 domain-containing protein n=1 Tax=Streptomonospora nanhaiensis TaxID=1323731 RepID=UPI0015CBCCDA|nr:DUF397 domain-containing protein [Streptomonospora nanhaiensis]MBV2363943.1 DUF397 domain-containing protein [Streptomonospora nanhaiensis]MBX9388409.1 DUF397 domain-containing protein [Streptomonospora nanhaiensis]